MKRIFNAAADDILSQTSDISLQHFTKRLRLDDEYTFHSESNEFTNHILSSDADKSTFDTIAATGYQTNEADNYAESVVCNHSELRELEPSLSLLLSEDSDICFSNNLLNKLHQERTHRKFQQKDSRFESLLPEESALQYEDRLTNSFHSPLRYENINQFRRQQQFHRDYEDRIRRERNSSSDFSSRNKFQFRNNVVDTALKRVDTPMFKEQYNQRYLQEFKNKPSINNNVGTEIESYEENSFIEMNTEDDDNL